MFLHKFLHIYQLKDYNNAQYCRFFLNKRTLYALFCPIFFIFEIFISNIWVYISINTIFYIVNLVYMKNFTKSRKTPLKFTSKLTRLYIFSILTIASLSLYSLSFLIIIIATFFSPIIANTINIYDKIKNKRYILKAKNKLKNSNAKIIAITGSNGKTSVKNILNRMLETQHTVQASPASFNTPLGIAKFINAELKHNTEFLILEYGARRKNDIKKLCKLYGAHYGIITTISNQHLESFHSTENIFRAKQELANHLQNKLCVFNIDNLYTKRMFFEKNGEKFSVSTTNKADIFASKIRIENFKTHFELHINKKTYSLKTNLLGRHNILNICIASALARHLNISTENIITAIENLEQVPHRLSLTQTHINILDDSYNCSPASSLEALWVLKNFPGKHMIATPGIVECGKEKSNINFNLGKKLAHFNYVIIIGNENKHSLEQGIKKEIENSNLQPHIYFANTLNEAMQYFKIINSNDTLLLLNDLPDDYS